MKTVLVSTSTHDAANYCHALSQAGIKPIVSGNMEDAADYDGLLLPGGGDIDPILYYERKRGSRSICIAEDLIQLLIFNRFLEAGKPILGICKGMQLINVALGGRILQEIPQKEIHIDPNNDRYHITKALPGSILHTLYKERFITNSAHHQSISIPGENLTITQYSFDGIPEGIELKDAPVFAVQWHPERLLSNSGPSQSVNGLPIFLHFRKMIHDS